MRMMFLLMILAALCGCSRKQDFGCADNLKTRVPIGASIDAAEAAIKGCGFEYSLQRSARVLHAIKRGEKKGLTQESRAVVIRFDQLDRVSSVEVKPEFTGP